MFDFERDLKTSVTLKPEDFEKLWKSPLSAFVRAKISEREFRFRELTESEQRMCRKEFHRVLTSTLTTSGEHRHEAWVRGWGENAQALQSSGRIDGIKPRYFEKIPVVRWQGRWILPLSPDFEFHMFEVLQYFIFDRTLRDSHTLYEFGCGTGHNLLRARAVNSKMALVGLDWAESSQEILRTLKEKQMETNIEGHRFDFFHPPRDFHLKPESDIMTLAALEQTGDRFGPFLNFLLRERPRRIIHIEPIEELLNPHQEIDRLSIDYFHKRHYLRNYLTKLQELEADGKLFIERAERSWLGSFFIEGYSIIVWHPLNKIPSRA